MSNNVKILIHKKPEKCQYLDVSYDNKIYVIWLDESCNISEMFRRDDNLNHIGWYIDFHTNGYCRLVGFATIDNVIFRQTMYSKNGELERIDKTYHDAHYHIIIEENGNRYYRDSKQIFSLDHRKNKQYKPIFTEMYKEVPNKVSKGEWGYFDKNESKKYQSIVKMLDSSLI